MSSTPWQGFLCGGSVQRLRLLQQTCERGSRDDGYPIVLRGIKVLIPGHEVPWWRLRWQERQEDPIVGITNRNAGWLWHNEVCDRSDDLEKGGGIHTRSREGGSEFGAMQDGFEFGDGRRAHDGDETALQKGIDNVGGRPFC